MPTFPTSSTIFPLFLACCLAFPVSADGGKDAGGKASDPPANDTQKDDPPVNEPPKDAPKITPNEPPVVDPPRTPLENEKPSEGDRNVDERTRDKPRSNPLNGVVYESQKPGIHIYAVPTKHNYCPAGLLPVTVSGSISCGSPNTHKSYGAVLAHPKVNDGQIRNVPTRRRSAVATCQVGTKGCIER